jgi:hypothetical protein
VDEVQRRYSYQKPSEEQVRKIQTLREHAMHMARGMEQLIDAPSERKHALDKLEEVVYWGIAGIIRQKPVWPVLVGDGKPLITINGLPQQEYVQTTIKVNTDD